jgi:hypothetical protein
MREFAEELSLEQGFEQDGDSIPCDLNSDAEQVNAMT